jgi:GNAT superfamily N-acetyltransferase
MADNLSTSPKRKASSKLETPSKRNTWTVANRTPDCSVSKRRTTIDLDDTAMVLDPAHAISFAIHVTPLAVEGGHPTKHAYRTKTYISTDETTSSSFPSSSSSAEMTADMTLDVETDASVPAPTVRGDEERYAGNDERSLPAVTIRSTGGADDDSSPKPLKLSIRPSDLRGRTAEHPFLSQAFWRGKSAELEEYQHKMQPEEKYLRLGMKVYLSRPEQWAITIDVSCEYNGVQLARASGTLIDRELIRYSFYQSMEGLGKPTSYRIAELLDHHGYIRWAIKEYYLREHLGLWDEYLDTGEILQIDDLFVHKDWRRQNLGGLMITTIIERGRRLASFLSLAYALPSADHFWKIEEWNMGVKKFFMESGWTQVAETGWFAMDVSPEDESPEASPDW